MSDGFLPGHMRAVAAATLLLPAVAYAFQPVPLRAPPHAGPPRAGPPRTGSFSMVTDVTGANELEGSPVFVAEFSHVKKSLGTLLKFWLMGGCGAKGWGGTGELEAKHTSGTRASIVVDAERGTVSLLSSTAPSHNSNVQLGRYGHALLDELEGIAATEEAEAPQHGHTPLCGA